MTHHRDGRGGEPRASRIHLPHRSDVAVEIWMGGSDSLLGEPISPRDLLRSVIVDCAGDLGGPFRVTAGAYIPRVFMDAEVVPYAYDRLATLIHDLAATSLAQGTAQLPSAPLLAGTERIYLLCQYGMNRSGLLTGLLLRALGESAEGVIELVRRTRPGALSNETFTRLIAAWQCPYL